MTVAAHKEQEQDGDQLTSMKQTEIRISDMTCSSCAARIEKKLNKIDGVQASVNYATEKAFIQYFGERPAQDFIETIESLGYHAHSITDPLVAIKKRLILAAIFAIPIIALGMSPLHENRSVAIIVMALSIPVVFWSGSSFHITTWKNLRHMTATMDTLISLGTLAAFFWSLYSLFFANVPQHDAHTTAATVHATTAAVYFETAAGVILFVLLGKYFEQKAKKNSRQAFEALLHLGAKEVTQIHVPSSYTPSESNDFTSFPEEHIAIEKLHVHDYFLSKPGEKIATDAIIISGNAAIDTSLISGEAIPIEKHPGDEVVGSTINTNGLLLLQATRVGSDTVLSHITQLVQDAQNQKAAIQKLADKISLYFVPIVIAISLGTFLYWSMTSSSNDMAFRSAVSVLIIACPCALGLATPTALLVGISRGAELGILIKGTQILESTKKINTIVFDKTGTLTTGKMVFDQLISEPNIDHNAILQKLASLENGSHHPLAQAIMDKAQEHNLPLLPTDNFHETQGFGIQADISGSMTIVGKEKFMKNHGFSFSPFLQSKIQEFSSRHSTIVFIGWEQTVQGFVTISDSLKPEAKQTIQILKDLGISPYLLSGDLLANVAFVAHQVGIEQFTAEVSPLEKIQAIQELQNQGQCVAMVGDGINDAAALAQADLGIAMGSGADVAIQASDVTVMKSDLHKVTTAIKLARKTLSIIKGNLFWAFIYNLVALPIAAMGQLNPMIAGAAMAFSSIFVVLNSLRLRTFNA